MTIEILIVARHGKPGSAPHYVEIAREYGDGIPSDVLMAEMVNELRRQSEAARLGFAAEVRAEFRHVQRTPDPS